MLGLGALNFSPLTNSFSGWLEMPVIPAKVFREMDTNVILRSVDIALRVINERVSSEEMEEKEMIETLHFVASLSRDLIGIGEKIASTLLDEYAHL
jgi:hypothetical protein